MTDIAKCEKCQDHHFICGTSIPCNAHAPGKHNWLPCPSCQSAYERGKEEGYSSAADKITKIENESYKLGYEAGLRELSKEHIAALDKVFKKDRKGCGEFGHFDCKDGTHSVNGTASQK